MSCTSVPSKKTSRLLSDLLFSSSLSRAEFSSNPSDSIESHSATYVCGAVLGAGVWVSGGEGGGGGDGSVGPGDSCTPTPGPATPSVPGGAVAPNGVRDGTATLRGGGMAETCGMPGARDGVAPPVLSLSLRGKRGPRAGDKSPRLVDLIGGDRLPTMLLIKILITIRLNTYKTPQFWHHNLFIFACRTPMWSTGLFFRNPKFAQTESHSDAIMSKDIVT